MCCLVVPMLGRGTEQPFLSAAFSEAATPSSSSTPPSDVSSGVVTTSGDPSCCICLNTLRPASLPEDEQKDENPGSPPEAIVMDKQNWKWTCGHWEAMCGGCGGTREVLLLPRCPLCRETERRPQWRDPRRNDQQMQVTRPQQEVTAPEQQRMDLPRSRCRELGDCASCCCHYCRDCCCGCAVGCSVVCSVASCYLGFMCIVSNLSPAFAGAGAAVLGTLVA